MNSKNGREREEEEKKDGGDMNRYGYEINNSDNEFI